MTPRGTPKYLVHGSRERLKPDFIAFNFDRFRATPGPILSFAENLPIGCENIYNASRVFRTI